MADASRLSFMLQGLAKMIEVSSIERRIEALESPRRPLAPPADVEVVEALPSG
jgi:hypothetical protein